MRGLLALPVALLLCVTAVGCGTGEATDAADAANEQPSASSYAAETPQATTEPAAPTPSLPPGDPGTTPATYTWLDDVTPADSYQLTVVVGRTPRQVLQSLGTVERDLGRISPQAATDRVVDSYPSTLEVAQVDRIGKAVVVYAPYGIVGLEEVAPLSRGAEVAVTVGTTVELDTYLDVARDGRTVRSFDYSFRPPRRGALPEEAGLDWGAADGNPWATAWAFTERLTGTRIPAEWFEADHPTYVIRR